MRSALRTAVPAARVLVLPRLHRPRHERLREDNDRAGAVARRRMCDASARVRNATTSPTNDAQPRDTGIACKHRVRCICRRCRVVEHCTTTAALAPASWRLRGAVHAEADG